jgi:Uma2 family endonuclease
MAYPVLTPVDRSVTLHGVSWETYERLLAENDPGRGVRMTYFEGDLEIMVFSLAHEEPNRTLATLVEIVAEERDIDIRRVGSTTIKRRDLFKGFEPDSCFYIQNTPAVAGKDEIDFATDPPPDLVIEIDLTSDSIEKFPLFAALGIPEVWRFDGECVSVHQFWSGQYRETAQSRALPPLNSEVLTRLLQESKTRRSTEWMRAVRRWVRDSL